MTTKIHAVVDALGNHLRFIISPGQVSDITQAEALIAGLPAEHVLGDKGYDARSLRDAITEQGAVAVIPPRTTSPQVHCDFALYCERNLVERFFLKIKHFRRIATHYEQTSRAFMSMLSIISAFIWTRRMSTGSRVISCHRGDYHGYFQRGLEIAPQALRMGAPGTACIPLRRSAVGAADLASIDSPVGRARPALWRRWAYGAPI